ncbi:MAG TPA: fumarylacetoacetate hydrolase family protein [Acidothermaceae bacterium]|nr:fumarylacetoacetate hydrolase family protein [Acidothermaceae bacterium]
MSRTDTGLVRLRTTTGSRWVMRDRDGDYSLDVGLAQLLAMPLREARDRLDAAVSVAGVSVDDSVVLAPIDEQEVWAAGVTYERSREGRVGESTDGTVYDRVYVADRPELFFKAPASRVVAAGEPVGIRADSSWNVPEGELGLVLNSAGELFGYVVGNDMSSRSIEGANPLYLPQAKVYDRSCALGPAIVPAWSVEGPFDIALSVSRDDAVVFTGSTSTAAMARTPRELAGWLTTALEFPVGVVLLTGTGIVPGDDFTLAAGDIVTIDIDGIGTLVNPVVVVGHGSDRALQGAAT